MREISVKYKVYKFNELNKDIQEKLIDEKTEYLQNDYCEWSLLEDMQEKAIELLIKYFKDKATFDNVYYDLSYTQGSGAMIEFELEYYNQTIKIKQYGHYYHERSFQLQYDGYLGEKREENLKEKIEKMNSELAEYGYSLIDYKNFIDIAKEELEEKNFLEDGTIFNEEFEV